MNSNLDTKAINTWCPGCGNFGLLSALKKAVQTLIDQGVKKENILLVSGVGCHAKIIDYIKPYNIYENINKIKKYLEETNRSKKRLYENLIAQKLNIFNLPNVLLEELYFYL